jgi:DNA-binding FrmR family transcriptional regulator
MRVPSFELVGKYPEINPWGYMFGIVLDRLAHAGGHAKTANRAGEREARPEPGRILVARAIAVGSEEGAGRADLDEGPIGAGKPVGAGKQREADFSPQLPEEVVAEVRRRLRRAAGQVSAVERMLEEGRDCRQVVTQLSAAIRALEQAGFRLLAGGLSACLEEESADHAAVAKALFEEMFLKLS